MFEELDVLYKNHRESHMNIGGLKWVFKAKLNTNGILDRLQVRLVVKRYHQVDGRDYTFTFALAIK